MKISKKQRSVIISLFAFFLVAVYSLLHEGEDQLPVLQSLQTPTPTQTTSILQDSDTALENAEVALVTRVIDGDTIVVNGDQRVRYIGIDTPETVDPRREVECFGKEASDRNSELVLHKQVLLEKDVSGTDRYGRLLRYVYLPADSQDTDSAMVNELLVREGYAHASSYPPDIKYQDLFYQAEQEARDNNKGLWGSCVSMVQ